MSQHVLVAILPKVTGSIHGNNRVGTCAIADITVFGRIAGKNVAANK